LHQVICDGDVVAANMTKTATQIAEWRGIESTGKSFQVDEMMFFRFEDDKIVEIWEVYDEILLLEQLRGE
jgi:predicted ester cyclase